jgi:tetratricopeptide (TPR) repeat protein
MLVALLASVPYLSAGAAPLQNGQELSSQTLLHPTPDAPPQAVVEYYQKRLASYPNDEAALRGLANAQVQLKNTQAAIRAYRRLLELHPDDQGAKIELARQLSFDRQYDASIHLYHEVLKSTPKDLEVLEALARVYKWAGRDAEALAAYQDLLAKNPSSTGYRLEVARLQLRLRNYPAARQILVSLLSIDPQNRNARMELGQLELDQRRLNESLEHFDCVLRQNPSDPEALFGKARAAYYQGKIPQARAAAGALVKQRPDDFDALFLLASIERASGHRREAMALLDRAAKISPNNPEVMEMKNRLSEEATVTITTSASYARELGAPEVFRPPQGALPRTGLPNEDLRVYSYGTQIEFSPLRQVDSSFHLSFVPTETPPGPLRDAQGGQIPTVLTGVAVPWVLLSQNTWRASERFTMRGGAGLVRFGPGKLENFIGQAVQSPSATSSPLAYLGTTIAALKKFSLDINVAREAVTDSPPAIRLGVMQSRIDGGLNFFFTSRSELHLAAFYGRYSSVPYNHAILVNGQQVIQNRADHDSGTGGNATFTANLFRSARFSFDGGYAGVAFGFTGYNRRVYMGYYNPSFYQRHLLTTRFYGKLFGPLSYDFTGGMGLQQSLHGQALTRALNLNPAFKLKVSPHLSFTAGYIYYNTALALGPLRGNEVRLSTETKF